MQAQATERRQNQDMCCHLKGEGEGEKRERRGKEEGEGQGKGIGLGNSIEGRRGERGKD